MNADAIILYSYWRSSAAYRVRIGLALKGLPYATRAVHLVKGGGEQHAATYRAQNPQGLVPLLIHQGHRINQSMAILEYLDECFADAPRLLPDDPVGRARVRSLAQLVACDIHPLNNLRVLQYLKRALPVEQGAVDAWMLHWMAEGFAALETMLAAPNETGVFCHGDTPTLADCCLIPQLYNARRFALDLSPYPTLAAIEARCLALPAFIAASPESQPDAA